MSLTLLLTTLSLLLILVSYINLYSITNASKVTNLRRRLIKSDEGYQKGTTYPLELLKSDANSVRQRNNFDGKILIFTSSGCNICKTVYPYLEELRNEYTKMQFHIVMLYDLTEAKDVIKEFGLENFSVSLITFDQLPDLGIVGFPFSYLLSSDGKVIEKGVVNHKKDFDLLISLKDDVKAS